MKQQEAAEKKQDKENPEIIAEEELPEDLRKSMMESSMFVSKSNRSRASTFKKKEEVEMWNKANIRDNFELKKQEEISKEAESRSLFKRVFAYNKPVWMFYVGITASVGVGFI